MPDIKIEEEFMIVDKNGSEYSYHEFIHNGIKESNDIRNTLSLNEEIKNSIHKTLKNRGFDIDDCYNISYKMMEKLQNIIRELEK